MAILITGCLVENQMLEPDWIVDEADVLEIEEEYALTNLLSDFYDSTSVALVGVAINSVHGESVESYAESLYNSWELGDPETHNGILVLLLTEDRMVHIMVGSGIAQHISSQAVDSIKTRMANWFGGGEYRTGFEIGFNLLMRRAEALPWKIAYTNISEAERDSLESVNQILSAEGMITGFEKDLVTLTDSDGKEVYLIIPINAPVLSVDDIIGFTGRIVDMQPIHVQVLNLDVNY